MLRIYACSKEKDNEVSPKDATIMLSDSDTSSDFEPTDRRPIKTRRKQRQSEEPNQEISSLEDRNRSSSASHRETLRFRSSTQRLSAGTERRSKPLYADELFESDSALALAIHASMEDFEVQVGPISGYDGDDDTLPWNPHHLNSLQHSTLNDDAASPRGSEKEVHYVKFRRVNIVQDVLNVFMDPKVMEVQLIMELINEKALDDKIRAAIVVMAHKALLQEPKFIIDCFHSSIHNAVPRLLTKESIMELYENKRPTNRKVAQMIKPSNESLNPQEQAALTYLLRYVRSLDQRQLEIFLRFCTGSSVLCKDSIEVTLNGLCGLSGRPVAHTCGAVLESPCSYSSYPDFRAELDSVLTGDCFTMDVV
ncbi:E3 ubiquitin-protein ligase TOM1-like [Dissostichus eleginoides]|uniref:E3 ubiquitin-protein ligase TOM1-like n=1 Tax=Dissostichus eleginoides TaxID=100907 RepID=A0AAD9B721_DISEL|nr:E3 ubiquitin-protein ligase TOM1-like [Dissostichus eleginoides]